MGISSRARPARKKSRVTSLMALPPILLQTEEKSLHHAASLNCAELPAASSISRAQQFCLHQSNHCAQSAPETFMQINAVLKESIQLSPILPAQAWSSCLLSQVGPGANKTRVSVSNLPCLGSH